MAKGANEWTSYETHEARARRLFVPAAEVLDTPGWDTPIDMNDSYTMPDRATWNPALPETPQPVIDEARQIIHGARQSSHGAPERSFEAIAGLWNAYLGTLADRNGVTFLPLKPYQVADLMELLKIARGVAGDPTHRDHYVDRIGYAALSHELVSKEAVS